MGATVPERVLGRDFWPQVRGQGDAPDAVVSAFGQYACIRTRKWNFIMPWTALPEGQKPVVQLFDLEADPEELTNVMARHRSVAEELSARLREHIARFAPLATGSFQTRSEAGGFVSFAALPTLDRYT
jgi:arylsulfatase A-like enzyme